MEDIAVIVPMKQYCLKITRFSASTMYCSSELNLFSITAENSYKYW